MQFGMTDNDKIDLGLAAPAQDARTGGDALKATKPKRRVQVVLEFDTAAADQTLRRLTSTQWFKSLPNDVERYAVSVGPLRKPAPQPKPRRRA